MRREAPLDTAERPPERLRRQLGGPGAVTLGLGSILGTGVFLGLGLVAESVGPLVLPAVLIGAAVASCNGLSSARLAASHPVAGGSYEYGYRYLTPYTGFLAGWMFLCAKSASAATAALGFASYLSREGWFPFADGGVLVVALVVVVGLTALAASGLRWSNAVTLGIVGFVSLVLLLLIGIGLPGAVAEPERFRLAPEGESISIPRLLHASALVFVAYTGYGRVATMGEEVVEPERTIPRAIIAVLVVSMLLYLGVAAVLVGNSAVGETLSGSVYGGAIDAPLRRLAEQLQGPVLAELVALAAAVAMLSVLLNLILGLSRIVLAMARRRDLPSGLARLDRAAVTPYRAVALCGVVIAALVFVGDPLQTWSFSAFTVLIYYSITHLAALRLPGPGALRRATAAAGLVACLALASQIEGRAWLAGTGMLVAGTGWHLAARRARSGQDG